MKIRVAVVLLGVSQGLLAQTTWTVATGAPLEPTIALAAPGDILQLGQSHPPFVLDKGLVLLGPSGIFYPGGWGGVTTLQIPAGQSAHLVGLSFPSDSAWPAPGGQSVRVSGDVTLEDCKIHGSAAPIYAGLDVLSGSVAMLRCELLSVSSSAAMKVADGIVTMSGCEVTGLSVYSTHPHVYNLSGEAIQVSGGTLVATACEIRGGNGGVLFNPAYGDPSPALVTTGGSVSLTDCVVAAGMPVGPVSPVADILGAVRVARTPLASSVPSPGAVLDNSMVGMEIDAPLRLGLISTATATAGNQLQLMAIVGGFEFGAGFYAPIVEPLFGQPAQLVALTLAIPGAGAAVSWPLQVPTTPGLVGAGVWLQAIQLDTFQIRASAVVGGVVH